MGSVVFELRMIFDLLVTHEFIQKKEEVAKGKNKNKIIKIRRLP